MDIITDNIQINMNVSTMVIIIAGIVLLTATIMGFSALIIKVKGNCKCKHQIEKTKKN